MRNYAENPLIRIKKSFKKSGVLPIVLAAGLVSGCSTPSIGSASPDSSATSILTSNTGIKTEWILAPCDLRGVHVPWDASSVDEGTSLPTTPINPNAQSLNEIVPISSAQPDARSASIVIPQPTFSSRKRPSENNCYYKVTIWKAIPPSKLAPTPKPTSGH